MGPQPDAVDTSIRTRSYTAGRVERAFDIPYDTLIVGLESLLGRMNPAVLQELGGSSPEEAREKLSKLVGPSGLTIFQVLDHGALVRIFTGRPARARTYVFGNALIAIEMTKHVSEAGLYVPLRMFVEETGPKSARATYDLPSLTLAQFESEEVDDVAHDLDRKVEQLLTAASKRGP